VNNNQRAIRAFLDMFVADGDPSSLLTPDSFDPNEFAQSWDAASKALELLATPITALPSAGTGGGQRPELENIVAACGAIPAGNYSPKQIEVWLNNDMKPAVERARAFLSATSSSSRREPPTIDSCMASLDRTARELNMTVGQVMDELAKLEAADKCRRAGALRPMKG
jgi:hypothetical protein